MKLGRLTDILHSCIPSVWLPMPMDIPEPILVVIVMAEVAVAVIFIPSILKDIKIGEGGFEASKKKKKRNRESKESKQTVRQYGAKPNEQIRAPKESKREQKRGFEHISMQRIHLGITVFFRSIFSEYLVFFIWT